MDRRHGLSKSEGLTADPDSSQGPLFSPEQAFPPGAGLVPALTASRCVRHAVIPALVRLCSVHWAQCHTLHPGSCPSIFISKI